MCFGFEPKPTSIVQPDQLVHWLNINCNNLWSAGLKWLGWVKMGSVD